MMKKIPGVMTRVCAVEVATPPMIGASIDFMTSDPTPVLHMMGTALRA